jgi:hypothetical protein
MQTFALNVLAETLEVDRGVMLRAMRGKTDGSLLDPCQIVHF